MVSGYYYQSMVILSREIQGLFNCIVEGQRIGDILA